MGITCPSCHIYFPSCAAAMIRHRRELHFCTLDNEDNEYPCVFDDRSLEWRKMKDNDERVVKFRKNRAAFVSNNLCVIDPADCAKGLKLIE